MSDPVPKKRTLASRVVESLKRTPLFQNMVTEQWWVLASEIQAAVEDCDFVEPEEEVNGELYLDKISSSKPGSYSVLYQIRASKGVTSIRESVSFERSLNGKWHATIEIDSHENPNESLDECRIRLGRWLLALGTVLRTSDIPRGAFLVPHRFETPEGGGQ